MVSIPATLDNMDPHKLQQGVKWVVYSILIVNFGFYIYEDVARVSHTLTPDSPLLDWTENFATSIDLVAWFTLLALLELETYVLDDKDWTGWLAKLVHGLRFVCILMIAHTVFAYSNSIVDYHAETLVEDASSVCDMTGRDYSYVYNLEYTDITNESCGGLSDATEFYKIAHFPVVTDNAGLKRERQLAWVDLAEAVIWLLILLSIEAVVRLQERGIARGRVISMINRSKSVLYLSLVGIGIYWAALGHWVYLWDELVWIGGFMAIEMNISDWRDEIIEAAEV